MAIETDLISYWRFEERSAGATRRDSIGSNDLTPNALSSEINGKVGGGVGNFNGSNSNLRITDNTSIKTGDIDFTWSAWVFITDKASNRSIIDRFFLKEYLLRYNSSSDRFEFVVSNDGAAEVSVLANSFGSPSTSTWYYITAWHDSVNDTINIQVNDGTVDSTAHSTGVNVTSQATLFGLREGGTNGWIGKLDEIGFWKRVLTASERTAAFNSGNGTTLPKVEFVVDTNGTLPGGLISWWKLEEVLGTRSDFLGQHPLTDVNTVTQEEGAGVRGHCAQFTLANSEHLNVASTEELQTGDIDFTVCAWVFLDSKASVQIPVGKTTGGSKEYIIEYTPPGTDRLRFQSAAGTVSANNFGAVPTGTWIFVVAWHDSVADTVNIQIDNGVVDSVPTGGAPPVANADPFRIGSNTVQPVDGRIDEVGFWKKVLSAQERTDLFNSGSGNTVKVNASLLEENLISHWKLNEETGTRVDSVGSNDLTDNATVTVALGTIANAAQFVTANSEFLNIADNAALSAGDVDFSFAGWVFLDSISTGTILAKGASSQLTNFEYELRFAAGPVRFEFVVSPNGSGASAVSVTASSFGAPSTGVFIFIVAWHDSVNDTINIQVNNGTIDSTAHSAGVFDGTEDFRIGAFTSGGGQAFDGRIDEVTFWKRKLTTIERSFMYNSRKGKTFPPKRFTVDAGEFN